MIKQIEVDIDGRTVKGYAVQKNGVLWTHLNGETWTTETSSRRTRGGRGGAGAAANPNEIAAPMPGKIIKISAAKGAKVASGDVVIVMEAMKMEYTLKAQAAATVADVMVQPGEQVALGQVLAKLET